MPPERGHRRVWLGLSAAIAAGVLLVVLFLSTRDRSASAPPPRSTPGAGEPVAVSPADAGGAAGASEIAGAAPRDDDRSGSGTDDDRGGLDQDMIALRWSQVDLDALRDEMPDNLYWELGAPTSDPAVQEARAERRAAWNDAYGKVISGTATEEEIHAYYDERAQVSTDYLEFATRVLEQYGEILPARDVGLLELSADMHRARLQSMPRRVAEALDRKAQQDRLRAEWLADEAAFEQRQAEEVEAARR